MATLTGFNPDRNTAPFALAAGPARYVVDRTDWAAAARARAVRTLLLERGLARDALLALEQVMVEEPNRYRTLAGAATAAERLGDIGKAKEYYSLLLAMTDGS